MGVIDMKLYSPTNDFKERGFSTSTAQCMRMRESRSFMLDSTRRVRRPSSSTTKMLDYRQTSSCASESRPPRHPNRRISRYDELSNPINSLDLDDCRNGKFPAEILVRIESTDENRVLSNEEFQSLLGVEDVNDELSNEEFQSLLGVEGVNDDIVLKESYFQCLDIWS